VKHLVRPLTQDANRFGLDVLGVVEVDVPASVACELTDLNALPRWTAYNSDVPQADHSWTRTG
jgi:hypothetical protein